MNITFSRKLITDEWLEAYEDDLELFKPTCKTCDKNLEKGDFVDCFFPYETEYNVCSKCKNEVNNG